MASQRAGQRAEGSKSRQRESKGEQRRENENEAVEDNEHLVGTRWEPAHADCPRIGDDGDASACTARSADERRTPPPAGSVALPSPPKSVNVGRPPPDPGERLTNPNVGLERASRARLTSGLDRVGLSFRSSYGDAVLMSSTLSPVSSPKVRRRGSTRRPRAYSHLPPYSLESHESALAAIRAYLKGRTCYDTFPVSFRLIVLDSKLEVKKALQCLLVNGACVLATPLNLPLYPISLKAWSRHHYGTVKSHASQACSLCPTSYILYSTTTSARRTMLPPPMSRLSV